LALLARDRPDAAIVEAVMPDVSGTTIAGQVLAGGIPVLMMTGEPATHTLFGAYGIPFLAKPFHIGDLKSAWRRLLSDPTERHAALTAQIALLVFDVRQTARSLNSSRENLARVVAALR
jgi:DNA-binding response OmpR family regulator